jgi:transketolase
MRNAFAKKITTLAKDNKKIILLSGDIGNKLFDDFKKKCNSQFYNCGVSENNMIGVAAGLAKVGYLPFVYTITPFLVSRSFEQIKLDIAYPKLPITIVGTGSGLSYSRLGTTHHSLDDISLIKNIPNMRIVLPGDPIEVEKLLPQIIKDPKPTYFRLGKKGEPIINQLSKEIKLSQINIIKKGKNILIFSIGNMLGEAYKIFSILEKKKIESSLVSFIAFDENIRNNVENLFKDFDTIVFLEEHFFEGGITDYIINYYRKSLKGKNVIYQEIQKKFYIGLGEQEDARKILKITAKDFVKKILNVKKNRN